MCESFGNIWIFIFYIVDTFPKSTINIIIMNVWDFSRFHYLHSIDKYLKYIIYIYKDKELECSKDDFLVRKALFVLPLLKLYFHIYQKNFSAQFLHQTKTNCGRIKIMLVQIFDRLTDRLCVSWKIFILTLNELNYFLFHWHYSRTIQTQ